MNANLKGPVLKAPILKGIVAVVTGASRGAGRGIALALGAAGATVYVTGRSVRGAPPPDGMPGTVDDTAEQVTAAGANCGGRGIAVRCDHTVDVQVQALFSRVRAEHGRLDVLVNSAWGFNEGFTGGGFSDGSTWTTPFWEQSLQRWQATMDAGARAHLISSRHAVPLMLPARRGLIVTISAWDRGLYLGNLYYDVAKATFNRLAFAMAQDLRPHGIASVALCPGHMRTERVLAAGVPLAGTESTAYVGRAAAALAEDPRVLAKSGATLFVADLAREYGFIDEDGTQPERFRIDAD